MEKMKIGFIGCGNMGGALAKAVASSAMGEVLLADALETKAYELASKIDGTLSNVQSIESSCNYIFLGVKPQVMPELLESIAPILKQRQDRFILVTMAAGIKIEKINQMLDAKLPTIRIMPNTPVSVGEGMILYSPCKAITLSEEKEFKKILKFAGRVDKLDEDLIDAGCAISGCGPAFVYMFATSMAKAGEKCGLPPKKAIEYTAQTLMGAAKLMLNSKKSPETLKKEVCSPKGATIEGVISLENSHFDRDVDTAIKASYKRTKELGQ